MTLAERVSAFLAPPQKAELAVIAPPQKAELAVIAPPQKAELAVIAEKAITGPGAFVMEYHEPLSSNRRNPQKFMKYAQQVSRHNPWVNTAEGIITGKGSTVPWHIEDAEAETVEVSSAHDLLERPNAQMTRSRLWGITLRHMGVCGNAFWFLDQLDGLAGTPAAIYYINPARMSPATDARGNLTGWILDAEDTYEYDNGQQTGVGLKLEEVIHFALEMPDWGYLGHGLVEAAESLLALNNAAERYLTQVMATGGRRGHFIGPKDGRMDDDVFQALVAGLRNIAESPDAAKRNIVTKGPLETTPQAVTPNEVGAMGVLTEMREDLVSGVWRVPLSQLGIPLPAGLNSGDARKYDEASLWQNAIEPRLRAFSETLQFQLLDRWRTLGTELNIVLETPTFDDNLPAWDLLAKSEMAPVTWNEQRALVGLDPLPDYGADGTALGVRITMPSTLVQVAVAPDVTGAFLSPVVTAPSPPLLTAGKAAPLGGLRASLEQGLTPKMQQALGTFLAEQRTELIERLRARAGHLLRKPSDTSKWWNQSHWDERLRAALAPHLDTVAVKVGREAKVLLGRPQKAEPDFIAAAEEFIQARAGERITGINATTREALLDALQDALEEAVEEGLSPEDAADLISERVGGLAVWGESRAELIARTELMNAYNDAALKSYQEFGVGFVMALDGDKDEECASRDGKEFSIDEAYGIADHPNGTLDWSPVVGKAVVAPPDVSALTAVIRSLAEPPIVNVPAPIVNVPDVIIPPATPIDMTPVAEALFAIREEQRTEMKTLTTVLTRPKRVLRDPDGHIVGIDL